MGLWVEGVDGVNLLYTLGGTHKYWEGWFDRTDEDRTEKVAKIKAKSAEGHPEGARTGGLGTGKNAKGRTYRASDRAQDQRLTARVSGSTGMDTWERVLLTRLTDVGSPDSLGCTGSVWRDGLMVSRYCDRSHRSN